MSDCNKLQELINLYCDNELTEDEKKLVEEHILICPQCKHKLDILTKTKEVLKNTPVVPVPENLFADFIKLKDESEKQEKKVVPFYKNYRMYASVAAVFIFAFVLRSGLLEQEKVLPKQPVQNTYTEQTLTVPPEIEVSDPVVSPDKTVKAIPENKPVVKSVQPAVDTPAVVAEAPAEDTPQIAAYSDEESTPAEQGNMQVGARMIQAPEDLGTDISETEENVEVQAQIFVLPQYLERATELLGDSSYLLYQAEQKLNENEIPFESNFLLLDESVQYKITVTVINE